MRDKFVNVAKSQIGVKETGVNNVKYNTWYYGRMVNGTAGTSEYAWCVTFICWCAQQVGILKTLIPKHNNVGYIRDWYKDRGLYFLKSSYNPQKGDLIIFRNTSHIGIVEKIENGRVWTIEGNSKDKVSNNSYLKTDSYIQGYCQVKFNDKTNTNNATKSSIKEVQSMIKSKYNYNLSVDGIYGKETKKMLIKALQTELNKQYNAHLEIDGIFGNKTKSKCPNVKTGAKGNITLLIKCKLVCLNYNISLNNVYDAQTKDSIIKFQKSHGLIADGICGKNTFEKLFK